MKRVSKLAMWGIILTLLASGWIIPPVPAVQAAPSTITINPIPNQVHRVSPRFTVTVNGVNIKEYQHSAQRVSVIP
ncbi:hypothetical protein MO973_12930 [Paenibacillus sp. TRM 82003]|nr:hypothetical protein [Paenibacillus sp. TRM 82003]